MLTGQMGSNKWVALWEMFCFFSLTSIWIKSQVISACVASILEILFFRFIVRPLTSWGCRTKLPEYPFKVSLHSIFSDLALRVSRFLARVHNLLLLLSYQEAILLFHPRGPSKC